MYTRLPARLCALAAILLLATVGCSSDDNGTQDAAPTEAGTAEGGTDGGADQAVEPDQGVDEFGKPCQVQTDPCTEPFTCVAVTIGGGGFCSKQCTNQGVPCNGAPAGTVAYCIVKDPNTEQLSCAFVCAHPQLGTQKCPPGLKCSTADMGGGLKLCEPE